MSESAASLPSEEVDMQACESCSAEHPIEEMHLSEDCWFCTSCIDEFKKHFDACKHEWEPHVSTMGDEGFYCSHCAGFVATEDFPDAGLTVPK